MVCLSDLKCCKRCRRSHSFPEAYPVLSCRGADCIKANVLDLMFKRLSKNSFTCTLLLILILRGIFWTKCTHLGAYIISFIVEYRHRPTRLCVNVIDLVFYFFKCKPQWVREVMRRTEPRKEHPEQYAISFAVRMYYLARTTE